MVRFVVVGCVAVSLWAWATRGCGAPAQAPAAQTVADLVRIGLERHPKLQQAELAIEVARGKAIQAGLYPNPVINLYADELGDRTGPSGINSPMITQEIVTKRKLKLSAAAGEREVDQATWQVAAERAKLIAAIRQGYFELATAQARADVNARILQIGTNSVEAALKLHAGQQTSRVDVLALQVEMERYRADLESTRAELPGLYRKLAAIVGAPDLPPLPLKNELESPLPDYDLEKAKRLVVAVHPEAQAARIGVDRAKFLLARAQADACPNVTVGAGYVWQGQNRSHDVSVSLSVPAPVWNRNQGNIRAAQAVVSDAVQEIARVEADLVDRLSTAYRDYAAAKAKVERFRATLIPRTRELAELAAQAQAAGQLDVLRVLEVQRSVELAKLEYVKALGDAWKAAATIGGLTLEQ